MLSQQAEHIALSYFEALDSPRSLSCFLLLKYQEYVQLLEQHCNPLDYSHPENYLRDVSATSFLRKFSAKLPGLNPTAAAVSTWYEGERQCFRTNRRLFDATTDMSFTGKSVEPRLDQFLDRARSHVRHLIGSDPGEIRGRFGPGATLSDKYGCSDVLNKMSSSPTLADHSFAILTCLQNAWGREISSSHDIKPVAGNRYFTVPKTALTDRSCAKEPSINAFVQLGLGGVIRRRLLKRGIDLGRSQDLHKSIAMESSITGLNATIDLSNASDTVSCNLVQLLVPTLWWQALDQARSRSTVVDGRTMRLEKFSSMGNGFTFELETVLFFAIVCSVSSELLPGVNVHVYGDDIIVPSTHVRDVIAALSFFGFQTNSRKTFVTGPFRESCGGDFFMGSDVRPIFLKEEPNDPQSLIVLANQLHTHSRRFTDGRVRDAIGRLHDFVTSCLPWEIRRCKGPDELGSLCITCDDSSLWRYKWVDGIRYLRTLSPIVAVGRKFSSFSAGAQLAAAVYGISLSPDRVHPRVVTNGVSGFRLTWTPWS